MSYGRDGRREEAEQQPIEDVAQALGIMDGLKRLGREYTGPCPQCGGNDRFSINVQKGVFGCRKCDGKGGGINLVMFVRGCTFPEALEWMCGPSREISAEERRAREVKAQANRARNDAETERRRAKAIADAREIWAGTSPAEGTAVRDYLALRGISGAMLPVIPATIRFHAALPYMMPGAKPGEWVCIHRGPAMVAAIWQADRSLTAVHRTWIDLSEAKGKVRLPMLDKDEDWPAKKVWGHKKAGAIRLSKPSENGILVMAEGIENTLIALAADRYPGAAYWCGVDMGNMAGRMNRGKGQKYAGLPDLSDTEAFVPPAWVKRLIYVMDGDSEPRETRAKMEAGLRRAMVMLPGLQGQIAPAPQGQDLNDVLMQGVSDEQG